MDCPTIVAREREEVEGQYPLQPDDVSLIRAELLQLFRSTVRMGRSGGPSSGIGFNKPVSFTARLANDARVTLGVDGDTRAVAILQAVLLLHEVGLANVHKCSAPDCNRLYVKVYRRKFCSVQCQKRINTRIQRGNADYRRRARRRQKNRRV